MYILTVINVKKEKLASGRRGPVLSVAQLPSFADQKAQVQDV